MIALNRIIAYFLSIALALGTINPFALNSVQETPSESILISFFSVLFMLVTAINYVKTMPSKIDKRIVVSSLVLIGVIFLSDVIHGTTDFRFYFYLKFFVVLLCFFSFILFFKNNPQMIEPCFLVFSISCAILIFFAMTTNFGGNVVTYKGRFVIFGENPNSTSSRMSMAVLFFSNLLFSKQYKWLLKILISGCILVLFIYIIRSGSRGSFMVTLFGVILMFLSSHGRIGNKTIFVVLVILFVSWFLPSLMKNEDVALFDRMEELQGHTSREDLMKQALIIFGDNPIIGVGANGYNEEKAIRGFDHRDSHNIITTILAMGGTMAFVAFVILWLTLFRPTLQNRRRSLLPLVLNISIFIISLKTGGVITFVLMWYIYAVSYCWATGESSLSYSQSNN